MLVKELKEILKDFSADADIIITVKLANKQTYIGPVLNFRKTTTRTGEPRLVLYNNKEIINGN